MMRRRDLLKMGGMAAVGSTLLPSEALAQFCTSGCYTAVNVLDFGAVGDGEFNDLPAFRAAHDALGARGGILTGPQRTYRFKGTFTITNPVTIDFFNTVNDYTNRGAIIKSITNAPLLSYPAGPTRNVGLRNVVLLGEKSGNCSSQDGIVVANRGLRISNVGIFEVGRYGLNVLDSVGGSYDVMYISRCGHSGVLVQGECSANSWRNINVSECYSTGFNVDTSTGSDIVTGLVCEKNAYGIVVGPSVKNWNFIGVYTELNCVRPLLFKSGSSKNRVDFLATGSNEPAPLNQGASTNTWTGGIYPAASPPACPVPRKPTDPPAPACPMPES